MKMKNVLKTGGEMLSTMSKAEMKAKLVAELEKSRKMAEKEIAKAKKKIEGALTKAENYVKKNPEKAAMIAVGIGAAIGSALTAYAVKHTKGSAKKKK